MTKKIMNRLSKIVFSILLSVIMVTSSVVTSSITASAETITMGTVTSEAEFKEVLIDAMENRETSFTINYQGTTEDGQALVANFSTLVNEATSSSDYLRWSWTSFKALTTSGTYSNLTIPLSVSYVTTKEQEDYVSEEVSLILSHEITADMTDKEKISKIHEFIINAVSYDYTLVKRSVYNALHEGETDCQGYALLLNKMLIEVGIENRIVTGDSPGGYHAWNLVNVDGNWYHIDSTNDAVNLTANPTKYYMVTDAYLSSKGYTWDASFPDAVTTYKAGFEEEPDDVTPPIITIGNYTTLPTN